MKLKAPFPAFGGKTRAAPLVWPRLGNPRNYVEPFFFSGAMLWLRPDVGAVETVNDLNAFVSNFWRAVQHDPDAVAHHCDWPVNETDLHARHRWLVNSPDARRALAAVRESPDAFDAKIAGWWCWGACCWIGSGWCDEMHRNATGNQRAFLTSDGLGNGVNRPVREQLPDISGDSGASGRGVHASAGAKGVSVKRAKLVDVTRMGGVLQPGEKRCKLSGNGLGVGVVASADVDIADINDGGRVQLADEFSRGRGVHGNMEAGTVEARRTWLREWMRLLCDRLRPVRVCCGHWDRICDSPSTMTRLGDVGAFLDPPYAKDIERVQMWIRHLRDGEPAPTGAGKSTNRTGHIYANDKVQDVDRLVAEVTLWSLRWGVDPQVRIAVCGLAGEYPALEAAGWDVVAWKSNGGYGNQRKGKKSDNAERERVWFSPYCLKVVENQGGLFV